MNNPDSNETNELVTRALRGQLTEADRAELDRRLQSNPALRESFELDQSLEHLLHRLPNVPVSTNFTALVLQAVQSEDRQNVRTKTPWLQFRFARLATGLAVLTVAGIFTVQQNRKAEQAEMVRTVASFTEVSSAISPEQKPGLVFRDFEAIERLSIPADSELDLELFAALQK